MDGLRARVCRGAYEPLVELPRAREVLDEGSVEGEARPFSFLEGPVWLEAYGQLFFTDMNNADPLGLRAGLGPPSIVYALTNVESAQAEAYFAEGTVRSNGMAVDEEGRLVVAAHDLREIARIDLESGLRETVVDNYEGARFNAPNDLVIATSGRIYFTDPAYDGQVDGRERELDFEGVFTVDADGELALVDDGLGRPNGVTLSVDERWLYVSSRRAGALFRYALDMDGAVGAREFFADASGDGVAIDCAGNLYVAVPNQGVRVYDPDGERVGRIPGTGAVTNVAFGGEDHRTLFITERTRLKSVSMPIPGLPY